MYCMFIIYYLFNGNYMNESSTERDIIHYTLYSIQITSYGN